MTINTAETSLQQAAMEELEQALLGLESKGEQLVDPDVVLMMMGDYCMTARIKMADLPPALKSVDSQARERRRTRVENQTREDFTVSGLLGTLRRAQQQVS